ncbi:glycine zipper 2TM domain-containing protein [Chitinimonas sp. BJYL2]|uniref:glycine zipper 2TM domain-containing protein n=1 Tax=Chitinimonas sp. BJYL2 TaxID=2976696 RepID=UPI0022B4A359|nr:glycine zipper 2TM domain-containing protein [Chitinimonas sp. BJYL2]
MSRLILIPGVLAVCLGSASANSFEDTARVRSVEPEYERISMPRRECTVETVYETRKTQSERSYGGAVVGGIAGGLLGNQVGKGHGREAATAVGAVIGALAGDRLDNRDRRTEYEQVPSEIQRCRTVDDWQTRVTGYRVVYDYRGQQYSTVLRDKPGKTLPVRVSVEPLLP